jgi:hypothetical protein
VKGSEIKRCFYCLDPDIMIGICVECRTKLELAKDRVARAERDAELWRRAYYKLSNERKRRMR